ncbi:MAG: hypothetical protein KKB51_06090 [Candidatus Riflebacteria bacterium]|nr:hypothetical protein [Candidatus Riflebacteria bacterium]
MKFDRRIWPNQLNVISLEVRYAVERTYFAAGINPDGSFVDFTVEMALSPVNYPSSNICYSSWTTPPGGLDGDFVVFCRVDALDIANHIWPSISNSDENEFIMRVAASLLPEFRRRCFITFMQLSAAQSNVLPLA